MNYWTPTTKQTMMAWLMAQYPNERPSYFKRKTYKQLYPIFKKRIAKLIT